MLKVHAEVVGLDGSRVVTNDFHFTFDSKLDNLPNVLPKTYAGRLFIYLFDFIILPFRRRVGIQHLPPVYKQVYT